MSTPTGRAAAGREWARFLLTLYFALAFVGAFTHGNVLATYINVAALIVLNVGALAASERNAQ